MSNVKLEPGWLERDVIQAARRTHELDELKAHTRKTGETRVSPDNSRKPDQVKGD